MKRRAIVDHISDTHVREQNGDGKRCFLGYQLCLQEDSRNYHGSSMQYPRASHEVVGNVNGDSVGLTLKICDASASERANR